ncbi:MAG: HAD-IIB family hydrolase [Leptolyngbya sp.]|nr:HAD-IIB family hydrolase [Leptolyngbya sp.]
MVASVLSAAQLASIALVATDMDGTLTHQGRFTPRLLDALAALAAAQISVVIVTGRSAGWVQAIAHYLPIAGAIAENGGLYMAPAADTYQYLVDLEDPTAHRQHLAAMFERLRRRYPHLQPSGDNAFRLTDWTFDVAGLAPEDLAWLATTCEQTGWGFTYSTVQCHIRPAPQDKGPGLSRVLAEQFPQLRPDQVVTVGDSPNDEGLFDPRRFPLSVGVANVAHYRDRLTHFPRFVTQQPEVAGFCELAAMITAMR